MKNWRNFLQPFWKWVLAWVFVIFVIAWVFFVAGCSSTVRPARVESKTIAFDGSVQNAGVLKFWPGEGVLLTDNKKAEYDALVAKYGKGTVGHEIVPPISATRGLTKYSGAHEGFPLYETVWYMDAEAFTNFKLLKAWQNEGREPR